MFADVIRRPACRGLPLDGAVTWWNRFRASRDGLRGWSVEPNRERAATIGLPDALERDLGVRVGSITSEPTAGGEFDGKPARPADEARDRPEPQV